MTIHYKEKLRAAATAAEIRADAEDYFAHPPPDSRYCVAINWTWGSGTPGAKAIQDRVRGYIEASMPSIIARAVDDIQQDERLARKTALEALQAERAS